MKSLAILAVLAAPAGADPACKPRGAAILQIDHSSEKPARERVTHARLYGNGAWTLTRLDPADADEYMGQDMTEHHGGCLDAVALRSVRAALVAAPWKTKPVSAGCVTASPTFTEYRWNGKLVFTARDCGGTLDDKSRQALSDAEQLLK